MEVSPDHMTKRAFDSKTPSKCLTAISQPKPNQERLCLAQISNTLLKQFSYNEIHNRRVALGITCIQCTPVQLEILRRAGAMPVSSRRCGMITRREAERLCKSFLGDNTPPRLPEDFAFTVHHECAWGCRGSFLPSRYNSSRAKCIKCSYCGLFFSPNKFIFHSHRMGHNNKYVQPDAANFNSWRRHMKLSGDPPEEVVHAWEDVKAMFNGGTRKRLIATSCEKASDITSKRVRDPHCNHRLQATSTTTVASPTTAENGSEPLRPTSLHSQLDATNANRKLGMESSELSLNFSRTFMMDYMWHAQSKSNSFQFSNIAFPWIKRPNVLAFRQNYVTSEDSSIPPKDVKNFEQLSNCSAAAVATASRIAMLSSNCVNSKLTSFCNNNNSAFKPVLNSERNISSSSLPHSVGSVDSNEFRNISRTVWEDSSNSNSNIKESLSSDDEMVDIETTEEEEPKIIDENIVSFKSSPVEQLRAANIEKPRNPELVGLMKKEVFEHSSFHY